MMRLRAAGLLHSARLLRLSAPTSLSRRVRRGRRSRCSVRRAAYDPSAARRRRSSPRSACCPASFGLNAAGALPGALRHVTDHITNTIVHTFGRPAGAAPTGRRGSGAPRVAADTRSPAHAELRAVDPACALPALPTRGAGRYAAALDHAPRPQPTSTAPAASDGPTVGTVGMTGTVGSVRRIDRIRRHRPVRRRTTCGRTPNTPPGFPSDWRRRAIEVARAQLDDVCAVRRARTRADARSRPRSIRRVTPATVHWTLLNQPLAGATADRAVMPRSGTRADHSAGTEVSVYGLFQMEATYTVGGDATQPRYAYSGGVAQATMTWDGSAIPDRRASRTASVAGQLPTRRAPSAVRAARRGHRRRRIADAQSGFAACATTVPVANSSIANCPQTRSWIRPRRACSGPSSAIRCRARSSSFDPDHGDFTVTGTYAMTLTSITAVGPDRRGHRERSLHRDARRQRLASSVARRSSDL